MGAMPDEILDAILNGADASGRSRLEPKWRFAARGVSRRWCNIIDGASRFDARRIRRETPRGIMRPHTTVYASAFADLVRTCGADDLPRPVACRAVALLWTWAGGIRGARTSEIIASMFAASTRASIALAFEKCGPPNALPTTSPASAATARATMSDDANGCIADLGGILLPVACSRCAGLQVATTLVDVYGVRLSIKAMAAAAGAGRCDAVAFMLLRIARSGDCVMLRSMARTAWLRAAWRDTLGRTAAMLARLALLDEASRADCNIVGRVGPKGDEDEVFRQASPAEIDRICAAIRGAANDHTPWWWFIARWGNISAFAACAREGMNYPVERALAAAAGNGCATMCAWLVSRHAHRLGIDGGNDRPESARARHRLAATLAPIAARYGVRCAPVLDWLRTSLCFSPDVDDARALVDAALGVPLVPASAFFGPTPRAIIYALDAWPAPTVRAIREAPQSLWETARGRLMRAVALGHWSAADALVDVIVCAASLRSGDRSNGDNSNSSSNDGLLCDVWEPTIAAIMASSRQCSLADGGDAGAAFRPCRPADLRRVCALALRCADETAPAHPTHDDIVEATWYRGALVDATWSRPGNRAAWRRCCRPTPLPRWLIDGDGRAKSCTYDAPTRYLVCVLSTWLDAVGLVAPPIERVEAGDGRGPNTRDGGAASNPIRG